MTLAIITALHGRYKLTRLFLDYYQRLVVPGVHLSLFCAVTKDEYRMHEVVQEYPLWHPSYADNMPLWRKFASCLPVVRLGYPDAIMILGSDDFVDAAFVQRSLEGLTLSPFTGTNTVHYLSLGTDQLIRQTVPGKPIGAGRVVASDLLDRLDWKLWDENGRGLDDAMMQRMNLYGIKPAIVEGQLLDVKAKDVYGNELNQTHFDTVRRWPHEPVGAHVYLNEHFPTLKQPLLNWCE